MGCNNGILDNDTENYFDLVQNKLCHTITRKNIIIYQRIYNTQDKTCLQKLNDNLHKKYNCSLCQEDNELRFLFSICSNPKCTFIVCEKCVYKYL
jgi:hypothetical protein